MNSVISEKNVLKFDNYLKEHPNVLGYNWSSNSIALNAYITTQKGMFNVGEVDIEQRKSIEERENSKIRTAKDFGVTFSKIQTIQKNRKIKYSINPKSTLTSALISSAKFKGIYEANFPIVGKENV